MKAQGAIRYISAPSMEGGTVHGFLTRAGGVSLPPYDGLNFDAREADPEETVEENRRIFREAFGVATLVTVSQVHGDGVVAVDGPLASPVEADAIITDTLGVAIGILTADCMPILLYDPGARAAAAIHAGWKGTARKVAARAVDEMRRRYGTRPEGIYAALGPYIGPCCYEVGRNVYDEFGGGEAFSTRDGSLRLDIGLANLKVLKDLGIPDGNIQAPAHCTSCSPGLFYSYRRDQGRTGRQLSFIMLK